MFDAAIELAAQAIEAMAALILAWGAVSTFVRIVGMVARRRTSDVVQREMWLRLARWLVLSLEFQLAADVLHTALAPTWTEIGRVAAIAVIRTFLSRALDADMEKAAAPREPVPSAARQP